MAGAASTDVVGPGPTAPVRPVGVPIQPLLDAIVADAVDPAYADAAAHRTSRPPRMRTAAAVLLLVGGLAVGLTLGQGRDEAPSAAAARSALRTDAEQRTQVV